MRHQRTSGLALDTHGYLVDGSIIKFADLELTYHANVSASDQARTLLTFAQAGLQSIVSAEQEIADRHNVSYGDM